MEATNVETDTAQSELAAGGQTAQRQTATIVQANALTPTARELTLQPEGDTLVAYKPGQWIALHLPVVEGQPRVVRPYTIANAPKADSTLTLCITHGDGSPATEYLAHIDIGTGLEYTGPSGDFLLPASPTPLVMFAQASGIAPFRAMLEALERGTALARTVRLVQVAHTDADLLYAYEFRERAARADWFVYHPLVGEDIAASLAEGTADLMDAMPFTPMLCGDAAFTEAASAFLIGTLGFAHEDLCVQSYGEA
jgi:ferredoxin-NADP reductase